MEAPPPYRPQRKSNSTLIWIIVVCLLVFCGGGALLCGGGGYYLFKQAAPIATCGIAMDDIHAAVKKYASDHGGKLPNAATWQDDVRSYYEKQVAMHKDNGPIALMPAAGTWGCDSGGSISGYAFNSDLSGKNLKDIKNPSETPLIFEVPKAGQNLNMPYKKQDPTTSPLIFGNHRGWYIVTVDGDTMMESPKSGKRVKVDFKTGKSSVDFGSGN